MMVEEQEIREKYNAFIGILKVLIRDMEEDVRDLERLDIKVPSWKQARDQEYLYTKMYEVTSSLDHVNRRLAAVHMIRSSEKKLRYNSSKIEFSWKRNALQIISQLFDILSDVEKAILSYRDTLDRKARQMNSVGFMISNERYQPLMVYKANGDHGAAEE